MDPAADLDPAISVIDLRDANKTLIKKKFFCLLLFEGTFTSFFKDKKSESRFFLLFFLDNRRIRIHTSDLDLDKEGPKHVDLVDPDQDSEPDPK
jgi:hypothetical protein